MCSARSFSPAQVFGRVADFQKSSHARHSGTAMQSFVIFTSDAMCRCIGIFKQKSNRCCRYRAGSNLKQFVAASITHVSTRAIHAARISLSPITSTEK
jgi:hypothetical protein